MHKKIVSFIVLISLMLNISVFAEPSYDLTRNSYVFSNQLKYALRGDLKNYASTFVECEEKYGVNAIFLSSIAALESGWASSDLAEEKNNLFGWRQNDGKYKDFKSVEKCIDHVAKTISTQYLDDTGAYYSGGTQICDIANYYSTSKDWTNAVCEIADQITERCEEYEETAPEFCCRG